MVIVTPNYHEEERRILLEIYGCGARWQMCIASYTIVGSFTDCVVGTQRNYLIYIFQDGQILAVEGQLQGCSAKKTEHTTWTGFCNGDTGSKLGELWRHLIRYMKRIRVQRNRRKIEALERIKQLAGLKVVHSLSEDDAKE